MSAKCPLICSAVELWYKMMLEIRNLSDLTENHIKRKAAGYQRLFSNWLWLFMAAYKPSFPDTKILKNITQNLIRSNLAGNFTKIMKTLTDILGDEFATESGFKTFVHTLDGCAGITKGFVVTDVTDNDIGSIEGI